MICFEIYVNGRKLCRAGAADATVLSCILGWVKRFEGSEERSFNVGGMIPIGQVSSDHLLGSEGLRNLKWIDELEMNLGDEITIKIVEADTADEPVNVKVYEHDETAKQERKYFKRLKEKYEPKC